MPEAQGPGKRLEALKGLVADNLRLRLQSLNIRRPKLQDEEPFVTLQVGKQVCEQAPRRMRVELWMSSLLRKGIGATAAEQYEDWLLAPVPEEAVADMEKDLGRTFPSLRKFAAPEGQEALGRVLRAYAALDPEVGYCQGMNFVAGLLLQYLPERHAFGGLVVLMQDRGLRKYYSTDLSLLQKHLWQLGRLMPPRLCAHLEACGVLPSLYAASWLMTCFSADFPASFSARIMDMIMADKMDQALLRVAEALLRHCEGKLCGSGDLEEVLTFLKVDLPAWDEASLHDVLTEAFRDTWTTRQLALLASTEGAETVAEAVARVRRANEEAEEAAAAAAGTGDAPAADSEDRPGSSASSRAAAAAAAAGPGAPGEEEGSTSGGGAARALLPPPPRSPTCRPGGAMLRSPGSSTPGGTPRHPRHLHPHHHHHHPGHQQQHAALSSSGASPLCSAANSRGPSSTDEALIDLSSPPVSPKGTSRSPSSCPETRLMSATPVGAMGSNAASSFSQQPHAASSPLLLAQVEVAAGQAASAAAPGVVSAADVLWDPFGDAPPLCSAVGTGSQSSSSSSRKPPAMCGAVAVAGASGGECTPSAPQEEDWGEYAASPKTLP